MTSPIRALVRVRDVLPDQGSFPSRLHARRPAALLGAALGVTFSVCFVTGLFSHALQNPPGWTSLPPRPAGLYRVTQGLHVAAGIASIPLVLAKLWTVYPLFWIRPAVRSVAHAVERLALLPLVAGSVFLLFTGVVNVALWYAPLGFYFPAGHYWAAWITIGAIVVHVGAKATTIRTALFARSDPEPEAAGAGLSRRGFVGAAAAASGALVVATVGQTVGPLRRLSVLAPRRPDVGSQGLPVNRAAAEAGVVEAASDPAYALSVEGRGAARPFVLTLGELRAMPQHEATLPIACVEGWSASARWRGVRVRDLLERAGAPPGAEVRVESLEQGSRYRTSPLDAGQAADPDALLALALNGEDLNLDHGFPVRLIAPNRPGVQQTKWVSKVVVL